MSKLYELEDRFDSEYTEIMDLFRESNVVYKTAVNTIFINVTRTVSGAVSSLHSAGCSYGEDEEHRAARHGLQAL